MKTKSSAPSNYIATSCWDGSHYANHSEWQFHVATMALSYIQLSINAKLLDIGCGDGRFTKFLATLIPDGEILGLDPSTSMLDAAQANTMPNLSFVLGDAMRLPFKDQFDYIVAFNSLHWVPNIPLALEQLLQALATGGKVLILVAPIQVRHPIHQIISAVTKQERWRPYFANTPSIFSFHTLAEWAIFIEKAEMIPECLQLIDASFDYPSKKAFADFVAGWIPFGTIPEDKKRKYIHDVVEAYVAVTPCDSNGVVHYRMDELVIVASKASAN